MDADGTIELWQAKQKLRAFVPTEPGDVAGGRRNRGRSRSLPLPDQTPSRYFADGATVTALKKKNKLLREKRARLEKGASAAVAAGGGFDNGG